MSTVYWCKLRGVNYRRVLITMNTTVLTRARSGQREARWRAERYWYWWCCRVEEVLCRRWVGEWCPEMWSSILCVNRAVRVFRCVTGMLFEGVMTFWTLYCWPDNGCALSQSGLSTNLNAVLASNKACVWRSLSTRVEYCEWPTNLCYNSWLIYFMEIRGIIYKSCIHGERNI